MPRSPRLPITSWTRRPTELEAGPRYALRAAAQALDRLAWEDAAAVLERARAALELAPALGQLRGEVLLALGLARIRGGQADTGKRLCQQAAEVARRLGDGACWRGWRSPTAWRSAARWIRR